MWELMETGHYKYDPEDKHGPILYYFSSALNKALGIDASDLTQTQVRLLPILASIGLMILVLVGDRKSRGTSLVAAALFALSPFPVIYSAYYVQEILFTLIGFLLLYSANEYWKLPSSMNAARCGLWIGLFFATKETAIIHVAAVGLAVVAIQGNAFEIKAWSERIRLKQILVALGTTAFIWGFFYSAAFSDFSGIVDSFKTFAIYAERSQGAGHEKPFYYYFSIFWPHRAEGIRWGEAPFLILAAIGFFLLVRNSREPTQHVRLSVLYGFACFALYSIIPYKTPWLMLTSYVSFCMAAGFTLVTLFNRWPQAWARITVVAVTFFVLFDQYQATRLVERYAADSRNPYIYQHTSPQFKKLIERIDGLEALDPSSELSIAVGGSDNAWPLPWYLRSSDTIGYWQNPSEVPALDIVVGPIGTLPQSLNETHIAEYHGLRENVVLECWIEKRLWDAFMETR